MLRGKRGGERRGKCWEGRKGRWSKDGVVCMMGCSVDTILEAAGLFLAGSGSEMSVSKHVVVVRILAVEEAVVTKVEILFLET